MGYSSRVFVILLVAITVLSAIGDPVVARTPSEKNEPRKVSRVEYERALAEVREAVADLHEARQRLAARYPSDDVPDPLDCAFHPYKSKCYPRLTGELMSRGSEIEDAVRRHLEFDANNTDPQLRALPAWGVIVGVWAAEKALDYLLDVSICLVKADGPDGRGLEGKEGMEKIGDCFVEPSSIALSSGGTWTPWLNRDNPGGTGDFESLVAFRESGQVCANPKQIECRLRASKQVVGTGLVNGREQYRCELDVGGVCDNRQQSPGVRCSDYEVRFLCP